MDDGFDLDWTYHVFGKLYASQDKLAKAEAMR